MDVKPIVKQEKPATYTELGVIKVGDGLFIDNAGTLSTGYDVTATAGTGGSITPAGTTKVKAGGEITLYITPNENYRIDIVTINGVQEAEPANEYTFTDLSENKTITVTFKEKIFIFKNGVFNPDYTITEHSRSIGTGNYSIDGNNLKLTSKVTSSGSGQYWVSAAIDLTNFKKIYVDLVDITGLNSSISCVDFNGNYLAGTSMGIIPGTYYYDVSNISGIHNVSIVRTMSEIATSYVDLFVNNWYLI